MSEDAINHPPTADAQTGAGDEPPGRASRSEATWEEKFVYYASLSPRERSYAAVAAKFGGSVRTVETHGRKERWKERLREVEKEAAARNHETLVENQIEKFRTIQRLIDDSLATYEQRLREGMRMGPVDLERLYRLSRTVLDELTETSHASEPPPPAPERTPEHIAAVVDALVESGALEQLGLIRRNPQELEGTEKGGS